MAIPFLIAGPITQNHRRPTNCHCPTNRRRRAYRPRNRCLGILGSCPVYRSWDCLRCRIAVCRRRFDRHHQDRRLHNLPHGTRYSGPAHRNWDCHSCRIAPVVDDASPPFIWPIHQAARSATAIIVIGGAAGDCQQSSGQDRIDCEVHGLIPDWLQRWILHQIHSQTWQNVLGRAASTDLDALSVHSFGPPHPRTPACLLTRQGCT